MTPPAPAGDAAGDAGGRSPRVVCLGVHIVDVLGRPVTTIPEGQGGRIIDEIRMTVAGTAAGTAVDLAKLGADVVAMGAIGEDELGDFVVTTMTRHGIDASRLARKPDVQTSATILPIRPNGERPAFHVPGANAHFEAGDVDLDAVAGAGFLHVGGTYALRRFDGAPAAEVLRFAKERGVVTTMDVLGVRHRDPMEVLGPCLPHLDWFMPNLDEGRRISGLSDPTEVARFFVERGAGGAVLKMDTEGSLVATADAQVRLPALPVTAVDSTGCGDAYCAGFIVGLSMGWDPEQAGRLGTAAAALVVGGLGSDAGIVDRPSTVELMERATG
ncbi:MAG TPA: sugar kinase [Acidimicrobiales bacterium]|nr:sugar kinase [Acidimicrobiales bacterium]